MIGAALSACARYVRSGAPRTRRAHVLGFGGTAACDPRKMLGDLRWANAADVPREDRCRRDACHSRFHAAERGRG